MKLISIVGPTAIGKTSLAIKLAQHLNTEIISCDSRQFYREMSIGTAKPSEAELASAKHHFINNKSIHDEYSVGDFEKEVLVKLEALFQKHEYVVMVGGSGLYEKAVTEGLDVFPEVKPEVRIELRQLFEEKGISVIQNLLKEKDFIYYQEVDIANSQRVLRALEVSLSSGIPYSNFRKNAAPKRNFEICKIGLTADREVIYERINRRVAVMMEEGLLEEARKLHSFRNLNALNTVGYKELFSYLENEISLDFAISEIQKNTRRFAKRQLTWFRKEGEISWFENSDFQKMIDYIF